MCGAFWLLSLSDGLVGDNLLVYHLLHQSQLLSHTHDRGGLLRRGDLGQTQPDDSLGADALSGQHLSELTSEVLVRETGLAHGLGAGLDQLRVHVLQDLVDLGQVLRALDGDGDGLCTGDGVLAHLVPPSTSWGLLFLLSPPDDYYYTLMRPPCKESRANWSCLHSSFTNDRPQAF